MIENGPTCPSLADALSADRAEPHREISRAIVRIYKEQFGRGPRVVTTRFADPDTIVCLVMESLTPVERNLRDLGGEQRLRDIRTTFQHAAERLFRDAVSENTGRRVAAFMSGIDIRQDVSAEVFRLEPRSR
jgi:uncharacterized protein YbcI